MKETKHTKRIAIHISEQKHEREQEMEVGDVR